MNFLISLFQFRKLSLTLCCSLSLWSYAVGAWAQNASAPPAASPAWLQDTRLQQKITLDETPITMTQLLRKVGSKSLPLACTRACAEQKLMIHVKARPLAVLMQSLAQLLPGAWTADQETGGYVFRMANDAVLKRERWWQLYLGERDTAVAELGKLTLDKMRTVLKPGPPANTTEFTPEQMKEMGEHNISERAFYNLLPPELQEQVATRLDLTPYYNVWTFQGVSARPVSTITHLNALPEAVQQRIRRQVPRLAADADAPVLFTNTHNCVAPTVVLPDRARTVAGPTLFIGNAPQALSLMLNHKPLAAQVRRLGGKASLSWKRLAAYQETRVWQNSGQNEMSSPTADNNLHVPRRRADVLHWLAKQTDLEYVSDYYSTLGTPVLGRDSDKPLEHPLKAELNAYAAEADISWKQDAGGLYLFRNNRWYRDDLLEVSDALLQTWLARWLAPAAPDASAPAQSSPDAAAKRKQIDWEADFAGKLTPWQIANGLAYFTREPGSAPYDLNQPPYVLRPFNEIADQLMTEYATAQFYADLTAEQRAMLAQDRLLFQSLSGAQQQNAVRLLPELLLVRNDFRAEPVLLGLALPQYPFRIALIASPGPKGKNTGQLVVWPLFLATVSSSQPFSSVVDH